jgi:hypothetical protein
LLDKIRKYILNESIGEKMDYKKKIIIIFFFFCLIIILSSCYKIYPLDMFYVKDNKKLLDLMLENDFNNKLLNEYSVDDTIVIFILLDGSIPINENKGKKLSGNRCELRIYKKNDSKILFYNINKIIIKTSEYEIDLNNVKYEDENYFNSYSEELKEIFAAFNQFNIDYEISMITGDWIRYPLPKDNNVNIILDIDLVNDNGYENCIFLYSFDIIRKTKWLHYVGP